MTVLNSLNQLIAASSVIEPIGLSVAFARGLLDRWQNGQIVNHDIQRALYEAYLNATLLACQACLRPLEKSPGFFSTDGDYFSDDAKSLRKIKQYVEDELERFSDASYVPSALLATQGWIALLLTPENGSDSPTLARQLKEQVLNEIGLLFKPGSALFVPASFRASILDGWQDGKGQQDWFEWVCGFFYEYLKTRPRMSETLEKQWLAGLTLDTQSLKVKTVDIEQSLVRMSGQVTELIALIKQLEGKTDKLLEYGRLIPIVLDLLQSGSSSPVRAKYLNTFAHYDLANLVGREQQLTDIENHFANHNLLLLRGMGGIGKTTLAKAYMARSRDAYDHLAYVEIVGSITDSMLIQLGNSPDVAFRADPQRSAEENYTALIDTLRHIPNLLLVLDNANDAVDLRQQKAQLAILNAKILITGRARPLLFVQERIVQEIRQLTHDEALQLFKNMYASSLSDADVELVEALVAKAFYHPKLIEVIAKAAYANAFLSLPELRTIVEKKDYDHQDINYPIDIDEQTKPIYRILLDLFDTERLTKDAQQLLRYFSVLPTIDIPVLHLATLLQAETPTERKTLLTDLHSLTRAGWLDDLDNRFFSMHGLVQWVSRERLKPTVENSERLIVGTIGLFYRLFIDNPLNTQPYLMYGDELLSIFREGQNNSIATLYNIIALSYGALGDNSKRLDYDLKALAILEPVLPVNHPDLATFYSNVAETYRTLGQYDKSLNHNLKALIMRETMLPANHPDLAASYNNIALTYSELGEYTKASSYDQKAITIQQTVLPTDPLKLATSYNNIALIYIALGEYSKALDYNRKDLTIREAALPASHPALATSYNNVGLTYTELGEHSKALDYHQKALNIRETALSDNHPDLAQSYGNIAISYGALGDNSKRLYYDQKALAVRKAALPANHPDLATSYNNTAITCYYNGDLDTALSYMQRAVTIREQVLPATHLDLISSRASLAVIEWTVRNKTK